MINLCMAYYDQPEMLRRHLLAWARWPDETRWNTRITIVDDGSPNHPAASVLAAERMDLSLIQVLHVKEDIPWNQDGARNLAMMETPAGWTLLTDMDHVLHADAAMELHAMSKNEGVFYVPARRLPKGEPRKAHPNSYIIHSEDFWRTGGYDEDFVGWYGSDSAFRRQLNYRFAEKRLESPALTLYLPEDCPDAMTVAYGRKGSDRCIKRNSALLEKARSGMYTAERPCRFEWERVL